MRGAALAAALALSVAASGARAESLLVTLSVPRIAVTSTFAGSSLVVFGSVERDAQTVARPGPYDVVVTVRGPRQALTVRERERIGPIWANRAQQKFADVPAYLAVLASRALTEVAAEPSRRALRIGLDAILASPDLAPPAAAGEDPFRTALRRLRAGERLFLENERGVTMLSPTLFRANVPLPATAPVGPYDIEVALFAGGVVLARERLPFDLVKTGFEQRLANFSRDWSLAYGLGVGATALLFGWFASVIFRRD